MELIISSDGVLSLVPVTKAMLEHMKILSEVDCFSLCDIIRLEFTEYLDMTLSQWIIGLTNTVQSFLNSHQSGTFFMKDHKELTICDFNI